MGSKTLGALPCLTANLLVQAISVLLTSPATRLSCLSSAVLVLAVPFGYDISGDDYRPPTERTGKSHLLGFVTLIYGIGQILGPALPVCLAMEHRRLPAPLSAARRVVYCCAYQHSAII